MGKKIPELTAKQVALFHSKVKQAGEDDCWEWQAGKVHGYGAMGLYPATVFRAHRLAYFIATGVDPGEFLVCHSCDNHGCCNPKHLWLGTEQENTEDRCKKGRSAVGERNANAKLTAAQVEEIRLSTETDRKLAPLYGVHSSTISHVRSGKYWR